MSSFEISITIFCFWFFDIVGEASGVEFPKVIASVAPGDTLWIRNLETD
jgi:hypothetical protein